MVQYVLSDHMAGETFKPSIGTTGYPRLLVKERRPYRTLDGYLCVLVYNDKQWGNFLGLIGKTEWLTTDPRFKNISTRTKHIDELYLLVSQAVATKTNAQWLELLEAADIPCMPLNTVDDLLTDPHLIETGLIKEVTHPTEGVMRQIGVPVQFSATTVNDSQRPAPQLGQNSLEILREIGLTEEEIHLLQTNGVTSS